MVAESTLYVCPGFYPGIVTFDDGSSIVLGALQSYIYAQKLDERGYYQWMSPLQVSYNDSSFITDVTNPSVGNWGGWVSDGDGGVILFWYDHRGAYQDQQSGYWYNNAIYAQRVDHDGMIRWSPGGILIKGPDSGLKHGGILQDGEGGVIVSWIESGFGYPGAPNKEYLKALRLNGLGLKQWEIALDSSSIQNQLSFRNVNRAGVQNYVGYYRVGEPTTSVFDVGGNPHALWGETFSMFGWRDSVLFTVIGGNGIHVQKLDQIGDTVWSSSILLPGGCQGVPPFRKGELTPDEFGGTFYLYACQDTIFHFDQFGTYSRTYFPSIGLIGGYVFSDARHSMVLANVSGRAQRYRSDGTPLWSDSFRFLSDPDNAYFEAFEGDKKGGIIIAFWTTLGGIFAHHTGREGSVGVITNVKERQSTPFDVSLEQNYPNPFNPTTTISYSVPVGIYATLKVFDVLGREVATLVDEGISAGRHSVTLDGSSLATGLYFYRLTAGSFSETKKLLLAK